MKNFIVIAGVVLTAAAVQSQFSFHLMDNFESGRADKWYKFGNVQVEVIKNPALEVKDAIAESCGNFSLQVRGAAKNWYAGGVGKDLNVDAAPFSRLQVDVCGSAAGGKLKIELFDDDNNNFSLEQDPAKDWLATKDDKWVAEVPVLGKGFTRISIPFTALKLENPGFGDGIWNPAQKEGSAGLLKVQMILLTGKQTGEAQAGVDNFLLTY